MQGRNHSIIYYQQCGLAHRLWNPANCMEILLKWTYRRWASAIDMGIVKVNQVPQHAPNHLAECRLATAHWLVPQQPLRLGQLVLNTAIVLNCSSKCLSTHPSLASSYQCKDQAALAALVFS